MPDSRQNAVVSGSLAEIRFVKSRSVAVLCVEIPIEAAENAIAMFGVPLPGQEIPVAVARLVVEREMKGLISGLTLEQRDAAFAYRGPENHGPAKIPNPGKSDRAKEAYRGLDEMGKAVTRAGMLCSSHAFQEWIGGDDVAPRDYAVYAAAKLRDRLGIKSRSEIGTDERAYRAFLDLEHQFAVYQGREPEPR